MWYEILPTAGVIAGCLMVPYLVDRPLCWLYDGKPYRRSLCKWETRSDAMRDERLTGTPYKTIGLEGIPDEPQKP
uniref:Putative nadh-ubiquinone oxidoreductase n=1 Tax=Amblyomma cajennense TaxID=34607 RepID=A0A023FET6_AMBCJ